MILDNSQTAVDALAAIAIGGPDAASKVTSILSSLAKAPDDLGIPDLPQKAIDALAAIAIGGPDAWRKATEILALVAKASTSRPALPDAGTARRR